MRRVLTILFLFSFVLVLSAQPAGDNCPPGMTNYWKLDEATGSPYLDSFGDDDALSTNPPIVTEGICGNAQRFNGGFQELNVPVSETFNWGIDDNFTIEYWMKSESNTSGNRVAIGRDEAYPTMHWWSGIYANGNVSFVLLDRDGTQGVLEGTTNVNDNAWHHIVCIRNADVDSIYLFVDGVLEDKKEVFYTSGFNSLLADINIGYLDLSSGFPFYGVIDEVALYNAALGSSEIETHYTNGLAGICYCDDSGTGGNELVLLADDFIKISRQSNSIGNIHSNGKITYESNHFWWKGFHTGNISALDKIKVKKGNNIYGDAVSGDDIDVHRNSEITGSISENAAVDYVNIPSADFNAGGNNVYVSFRKTKELEPGSYGKVRVRWLGKLKLTAGDYYFKSLNTDLYSHIIADITDGPVNVYVVGKVDFGPTTVVKAVPESADDSQSLNFTSLHNGTFEFGGFGKYYGSFYAPNGYAKIGYYTRLKGSVAAEKITVERGTQFVPHGYAQPFAKQPDMDTIEDETESAIVVEEYSLNQNYPNPFNPTTTLSFTLPEAGSVNLTVYDLLGQKVATLIDNNLSAGYHSAVFNANNLPSGIYIYRLVSENFSETKKMQLLK